MLHAHTPLYLLYKIFQQRFIIISQCSHMHEFLDPPIAPQHGTGHPRIQHTHPAGEEGPQATSNLQICRFCGCGGEEEGVADDDGGIGGGEYAPVAVYLM